jgi:murein DD-endopeptidase MepM/ murein hydrolase activator NlpD
MGGMFMVGNSLTGAVGGTSYLAEDADIDAVEVGYTEWDTDLVIQAKNAESSHPNYDEYRYNIDDVGHNPYELLAYLTAKHDNFTYSNVEGVLRGLFAEQYNLTFTPSVEVRYRTETVTDTWTDPETGETYSSTYDIQVPYDWHILTVTLTARSFTDVVTPKLTTQDERDRYEVYMFLHGNRQYVGNPFDASWLPHVSDFYGWRVHPITGEKDNHTGVDIALPTGTEILAGGDGVVLEAGNNGSYGLAVLVDYGEGVSARYAHCSSLLVSAGQSVTKGDVIALVGSTGQSTGPHLHFEVMKDGRFLNPLYFADGTQGGAAPGAPGGPAYSEYPGEAMDDPAYAALIAEGEKHLGKPYVFGASGPNSFDCSGFLCYILNQSGVASVGRTNAQGLYNLCTPVSPGEARPGDLVFFENTYSAGHPVTHCALYVGNGMVLHAGKPVQYASIETRYWQDHFYSFARLP